MAQRRMFSPDIVNSDAFLEMPPSTQALYFQLGMKADDDGFVSNPKRVIRMINVGEDDLKVLLAKRFLLPFESGVVVIKHWLLHNAVRKDMYKETQYLDEKKQLRIKDNGVYTDDRNETVTDSVHRLDQVRIDKDRLGSEQSSQDVSLVIDSFKEINPSYKKWFGNTTQRGAVSRMIETHGLQNLLKVIEVLPVINKKRFYPKSTTPLQLEDNWGKLKALNEQESEEKKLNNSKLAF